ncbi:MAG: hypothetical protein KKC79_19345 [Gammaproteobacteria bacterium]|nr:hypothetical protein [Gammaproteobacteria bacterium]MBU2410794.1 hypothetical protein [Gammaproteobacteria bacterium]
MTILSIPIPIPIPIHRAARCALLITGAVLIAACSGEPSASDIEKAVLANAAQGAAQMAQLSRGSSKGFMPQVHGVKKMGCRKETDAAYQCDVELDLTPPQGTRGKVPMGMRFVKGSDGWVAAR